MKIVYGEREQAYFIQLSEAESVTVVNTSDIVEERKYFIDSMTRLFNDAINKRLKNTEFER
jgi:hypothetical protein